MTSVRIPWPIFHRHRASKRVCARARDVMDHRHHTCSAYVLCTIGARKCATGLRSKVVADGDVRRDEFMGKFGFVLAKDRERACSAWHDIRSLTDC